MLIGSHELFYPPRVRNFLRRVQSVHYKEFGFPSIAFALGTKAPTGWYIFTLQSDLFFRKAYIRHHFRGWQRILLYIIARQASAEGAEVFLPRGCDIVKACYPAKFKPDRVPRAWNAIYDYTAKHFGMELVPTLQPVNCQAVKDGEPVYLDLFYCLKNSNMDDNTGVIR
jgi:hypothetical protein